MRIGIDCRLWNETGIGRYTRNLVEGIGRIDTKNKYTLFLSTNDFDLVELPGKNFEKKVADVRWHSLKEQLIFSSILNKENLDLVHFPYFSVPLMYKRPYVITIHDLILNHFPTGKASTLFEPLYWVKHAAYRLVIQKAAEKSKAIIAVSHATEKEIVDHLDVPPQKISVIYEGIDKKITASDEEKIYINSSGQYFLYVGNAYPHKNLELLITAFKKVVEYFPKVSLVLVGKEDFFYTRLKEYIHKNGLDTSVLLYGYATESELSQLYKNAVGLVYPSKMEGFGLPLLEAMHHNCLVIASDISVFKEIGRDAIVYFDGKSVESVKNTLIDVLENRKKYLKYIKEGEKRAGEFSWEKMAKETLNVYNSCQ